MKILTILLALFLFTATAFVAEAQLRKDLSPSEDYTASVTHTQRPSSPGNWMNLLNMTMSHSYSMTFSNIGGQAQNLNAYTNSMFFDISDNVNAQLDLSVLHSPFGNSFMTNNDMGARVIIDQARIDFKPSENTRISFQFSQRPYYTPYSQYGFGNYYSPYSRSAPWY